MGVYLDNRLETPDPKSITVELRKLGGGPERQPEMEREEKKRPGESSNDVERWTGCYSLEAGDQNPTASPRPPKGR